MKNLAVAIISLVGLALSPVSAMAGETKPAKPKTTKATKKKPCADEAKPAAGAAAVGAAAAVAAAPASPAVDAVAAQALATKHACMACHKVDAKLIGPGFKEIAAKYKDDKTAEAKMIDKVKKGGGGVWGSIHMPPHTHVPEAEVKTVVQWLLSLK